MDELAPGHDIDDQALAHLERLARLVVEPSERESLKRDLVELLGFVDQLLEVDVDGVAEFDQGQAPAATTGDGARLAQPHPAERPDTLAASLAHERVMGLAPAAAGGFFQVPRTVEEG